MKISDTRPQSGTASVRRESRAAGRYAEAQSRAPAAVGDSASVMGVPEAELTPKVREAIMKLMQEVENLRRELDRTHERLNHMERLADQDPLAPIANRRAFVRELNRVISFTERYNTNSSLVYFDINGFKKINDNHGHAAGDKALMHVAEVLLESVRESDIVGRLGGDEFGVILAQADEQLAADKAQLLANEIERRPLEWEGKHLEIGVAYGVTTFSGGESVNDALAAADRAMYERKAAMKASGD
ncbi:MAG: GGDEF domain-containing protein [Alphaproteobacteria bacterium]|nr:GGDEF domain-containing protein [Alphaproteobacteria bacterium]